MKVDLPTTPGVRQTPPVKSVVAIAGSLRRSSFNRLLLEAARDIAPGAGLSILLHNELSHLPPFNEDLEQESGDGLKAVRRLRAAVAESEALLIATPEYNWSIPGVLKNAIDWLSRGAPEEVLAGKPVAIIGASSGAWGTRLAQAALRQVLTSTESLILPSPALFVRNAATAFDSAGHLTDHTIRAGLSDVLRALAEWIDTTSPRRRPAMEDLHV